MAHLRYTEQAKNDLLRIKRFIAHESGNNQVAIRYTEKIRLQCKNLAELPATIGQARPELHENIRSFPYENYIIFFRYHEGLLLVVTIIERHRDVDNLSIN